MSSSEQKPADKTIETILISLKWIVLVISILAFLILGLLLKNLLPISESSSNLSAIDKKIMKIDTNFVSLWTAPSDWRLDRLSIDEKQQILYGRDLIAHTAHYLGPNGSVRKIANGMNCQNCHLKAGTQPWGNNYFAVYSTYPRFRARSGSKESIIKRVNDCLERSLNGKALDSTSYEMKAIKAYIKWLGTDVPKKVSPKGAGIFKLKYLPRAADVGKGRMVYEKNCQSCHQANGQGIMAADGKTYTYPPLWGEHSYNNGAGLFRISMFAGYVKYNMPLGTTYEKPMLSDEEAWDVAAFVNSMPRPTKDLSKDWPDIAKKPIDHPFGPYADSFSEQQHKYGPFKPIKEWYDKEK
jgi:thiosulfate dehydrogenase